ncbi:unnamed protein product [Rotaria sp. Silwood2]|nr:unnamed protein product [Rotaria sp. Silwood2]CAF4504047.1 unnamed protein product [Rotaria sp. Silwood2]
MANSSVQLIDLPDELLLIIFKKLNNVELLYSLMCINKQLDRILYDSIVTRRLTLIRSSSNRHFFSLRDEMLDRFCLEILPKIHRKIEWLTVESLSMERIFLVDDYSNLCQLDFVSIQWEGLERLFDEENFARCHYYSYPYTMKNYDKISNNFPGGLFKCVRQISLFDEHPFQHDFFIKISQAFPFLQKLTLENSQPQN